MNENITVREKAAFACANIGNIPIQLILSGYLMIFYTNIVGLNPAAVATLYLIARIADALNDPFVGYFIDHRKIGKMGRFRPTLAVGAILTAINFVLLFFGPYWAPAGKLAIAYVTYLLIGVLFPVMDISLNSLIPVMTTDVKQRNSFSTIKGFVYSVAQTIIGVVVPLILVDVNEIGGYYKLIFGAAAIVIVFSVIGALGVKERIVVRGDEPDVVRYGIKDILVILTRKPVFTMFLAQLVYTIGVMFISSVNTYYFIYVLGDLKLMSIASLVQTGAVLIGTVCSGKMIDLFGKKKSFVTAMFFVGILPTVRIFAPTNIVFVMVVTAIMGFGMGLQSPLSYGMAADNVDSVELELGYRAEGAVASLTSLMAKIALGVAGAIPGYVLAAVGFDAAVSIQTASVTNGLIYITCFVPAIFAATGMVIIGGFYPLTKEKLAEQNEKIAALRAKEREKQNM